MAEFIQWIVQKLKFLLPECFEHYIDGAKLAQIINAFFEMHYLDLLYFCVEPEAMRRLGDYP